MRLNSNVGCSDEHEMHKAQPEKCNLCRIVISGRAGWTGGRPVRVICINPDPQGQGHLHIAIDARFASSRASGAVCKPFGLEMQVPDTRERGTELSVECLLSFILGLLPRQKRDIYTTVARYKKSRPPPSHPA
jgi:hypothetical protein